MQLTAPQKDDIKVYLSKPGYKSKNYILNLVTDPNTNKEIELEEDSTSPTPLASSSPSSKSSEQTNSTVKLQLTPTIQQEVEPFTLELQSCKRASQAVFCNISIKSTENSNGSLYCSTRIFFDGGHEKFANKVEIVDQPETCYYQGNSSKKDFISDTYYTANISFSNVPQQVSKIEALEVHFQNKTLYWRNINLSNSNK